MRKAKVWKGQGTATAKGFVLVLLVENIVGKSQPPLFPKNRGFYKKGKKCGKKMLVKKEDKNGLLEKKGLLLTRESSGEGAAGGGFRMLEVSGGYEGIKEKTEGSDRLLNASSA